MIRSIRPTGAAFGSSCPIYDRVNGQGCTGTTEQILEWAARKWRFHEIGYADIAKAMAVHESWWKQSQQGDCGSGTCESFGILQVRITQWRGGDAAVKASTAMNADYAMAIIRYYFEGNSWMGSAGAGIRNAVGAYFCGCGNAGNSSYVNKVFEYLQNKPWNRTSPGSSRGSLPTTSKRAPGRGGAAGRRDR